MTLIAQNHHMGFVLSDGGVQFGIKIKSYIHMPLDIAKAVGVSFIIPHLSYLEKLLIEAHSGIRKKGPYLQSCQSYMTLCP